MKYMCLIFGHQECMKHGCCRKCEKFDECNSGVKCNNDPSKCGMYKKFETDLRGLVHC